MNHPALEFLSWKYNNGNIVISILMIIWISKGVVMWNFENNYFYDIYLHLCILLETFFLSQSLKIEQLEGRG